MNFRCDILAALLLGFILGCGGPANPPADPPKAEERIRADAARHEAGLRALADQAERQAKEQANAKVKELAELAEAAMVNATFKPMPQQALVDPDEYALACAVLDAPLEDKPKAAYADWLDRHQDARGDYLRLWMEVHAGRGGKDGLQKLAQSGSELPSAWIDMLGLSLWVKIQQSPLAEHADKMIEVARPCLAIERVKMPLAAIPIGASHGGGAPDVPLDWKWPAFNGPLLLQLNLSDVAPSPVCRHLPREGWLLFFGNDGDPQDGGVQYIPAGTKLHRHFPANAIDDRVAAARVRFQEGTMLPDDRSTFYGRLFDPLRGRRRHLRADDSIDELYHESLMDRVPRKFAKTGILFGYSRSWTSFDRGDDPMTAPQAEKGGQLIQLLYPGSDLFPGFDAGDFAPVMVIYENDLKAHRFESARMSAAW